MNDKYMKAKQVLKNNSQEHIIPIMENLNENKKEKIVEQILNIDFKELKNLYNKKENLKQINLSILEHLDVVDSNKLEPSKKQDYMEIGKKVVQNKKYAVVIMAGGQGTRLGHDGPKGTFKLNIDGKGKYLFEILIDKLKHAKKNYGIYIPCYIMTSKDNHEDTVKFFKEMKYFGYPKKYIKFFQQTSTLVIDDSGKILIGEDYLIKASSDGNGAIFESMLKQGVIKDLKEQGIEWAFIGAVDNILLHLVDTMLLGLAIKNNEQIASRTVLKSNPEERVGVFCKLNGKVNVIEYTELPKEMAEAKDDEGNLLYGEAHIMCNLFKVDALEKISKAKLEYHLAHKKITYLDKDGILVRPEKPNAYKFERFIFDAFNLFDSIALLRGNRETDFAPVKNAEGLDSPKTALKLYENYKEILKKNNT